jgi:LacI family transcriptional regulator
MVTILDVARRAGVSPMTVSRVVNGSGGVSPQLRARVEQALADTGYMPNTLARSLRAQRTDTIALLLPDMTNPFFTTLAQGVERSARELGISLLVANSDEREDEELRLVRVLLQRQVDGLLLVPAGSGDEAIRRCRAHRVPLVVVDRRPGDRSTDVVRADSEGAAHALGRLLADLGHRRMAVLTGPASAPTATDRVRGFQRAVVTEAGLPEPAVIHGAFTIDSGREMAVAAMAARPRPTALFAANNFIAIGVQHALAELGIRVPDEVALVGFDDLPPAMVTFPFLTVAVQPAGEIGSRAVEVLVAQIADPDRPVRDLVLPAELVIRRSSGEAIAGSRAP